MSASLRVGRRLGLLASHGGADPMAVRDELWLCVAMALLLAVVIALSFGGGGSVARLLFMLSALVLAVLTKRRSPWLYLSATLWFWLTTAFVRRMVEWHGGFNPTDPVLITPNAMALLIVPDIAGSRGLLKRSGVGYALLLSGCVAYGLFVSLIAGDLLGGAVAAADWLVPLLYLFLFICNAERIDTAAAHFSTFLTLSLLFVLPYALYQYFLMPDWDARWMIQAAMGSIGKPQPIGSHVFGSLNNPGVLAIWAGTCVVLVAHFRGVVLMSLAPLLFLVVAMTQVRSVWGATILAIVVGALCGRGGFGRLIWIIPVAGLTVWLAATLLDPLVTGQIARRLQSLQDLSSDSSAVARQRIYADAPGLIEQNPFGTGIAAQGRGSATGEGGAINIDSGPLSVLLALGWIAGPLYMFAMLLLQGHALTIGRRHRSPVASAMAAAAICPLATFPFVNVIQFAGVVLWICLGYALAVQIRATRLPP
jgi:hypothetical protein